MILIGVSVGSFASEPLIIADPPSASGPADRELRSQLRQYGIEPIRAQPRNDPEKVRLGKYLFFDKELSGNRDISCGTCHHPFVNTVDGLPVAIGTGATGLGPTRKQGVRGKLIPRNAPDLFNRGDPRFTNLFFDSRVSVKAHGFDTPAAEQLPEGLDNVLAALAMFPVTSRDEMRGQISDNNELAAIDDDDFVAIWAGLTDRLLAIPGYRRAFRRAFPDVPLDEIGFQHAANAISAFISDTFASTNSPWDRYLRGQDAALSQSAKRGAMLFYGKARCVSCHSGPLLTDLEHHNILVPQLGPGEKEEAPLDFGRGRRTRDPQDRFTFRTPPLRNVELTSPYMHNGAYATLRTTVLHHLNARRGLRGYDGRELPAAFRSTLQTDPDVLRQVEATADPLIDSLPRLRRDELADLLEFLHALTDPEAANLREVLPEAVPSGLTLDD